MRKYRKVVTLTERMHIHVVIDRHSVAIKQVSLAIDLAFAIELRVTSNGYRNGGADDGARRW